MHLFVVTGNRPYPDPVRPWKQTVRVGVVAIDIHRAIDLAREQSGMTEVYGVSHRGSVDVVDLGKPMIVKTIPAPVQRVEPEPPKQPTWSSSSGSNLSTFS